MFLKRIGFVSLFFIVVLLSSCGSGHFIRSGQLGKISWGMSKQQVLNRISSRYRRRAAVTAKKISYRIRYIRSFGYGLRLTAYSQLFTYRFNNNRLYAVKIAIYTGIGASVSHQRMVIRRYKGLARKYRDLLGKPDSSDTKAARVRLKNGNYIKTGNAFSLWKPEVNRDLYRNIRVKVKFWTLGSGKSVLFGATESYINRRIMPILKQETQDRKSGNNTKETDSESEK